MPGHEDCVDRGPFDSLCVVGSNSHLSCSIHCPVSRKLLRDPKCLSERRRALFQILVLSFLSERQMKTKDSDTLKRINSLIEDGEKFDFERRYDYSAMLKWIGAAREILCDFPNEQREFLLYCITSCAMPLNQLVTPCGY